MKYKKTMILLVLAIFIFGVASVCASDVNDTVIAHEDDSIVELSQADADEIMLTDENELISQTDNGLISEGKSGTFAELQANITQATEGSTLTLNKNYECEDSFDSEGIPIDKALTIDGNGFKIDAQGKSRIFKITAENVILKNIIFTNGKTTGKGGAVYFLSNGTVINCNFTLNTATDGGAIYYSDGTTGEAINCNFKDNLATSSGGALVFLGTGTVTGCNFINNAGNSGSGGAIYFIKGTMSDCNFTNNKAIYGGAIYFNSNGNVTDCCFTNNQATGYSGCGGAVYFEKVSSSVTVNCNFTDNSAKNGGAVYFDVSSSGKAVNCVFDGNSASNSGAICTNNALNVIAYSCIFKSSSDETNGVQLVYIFSDLQDLISANYGSILKLDKDYVYENDFDINGINIIDSITIDGQGHTIDANGKGRIFNITAENVILKNITFANGYTTGKGGAVYFLSNGTVINCNFTLNTATDGGAIYYSDGTTGEAINCNFKDNLATSSGGALVFLGTGTVTGCNFINNAGNSGSGGAIYFIKGTMSDCNFTNNKAIYGGAIYFNSNGNVTDCCFTNNQATGNSGCGGAVYFDVISSSKAVNCNFTNNTASGDGGAVYFLNTGNVTNCNFADNSANKSGGAVYFYKDSEVTNCNFTDNSADRGGAIRFSGTGTVKNCNFTNNKATGTGNYDGGGAVHLQGTGSLTNCNFTNNTATYYGGAIRFGIRGTVSNCNFTGNIAGYGGAVFFNYAGTVSNCNFTSNNATNGSAIYFYKNYSSDTLTVSNSIFLNNRANAEDLEVVKNDNNITIIFTGQNNLLNAIYSRNDAEVTFNNVKYWGANGITTLSATRSGSNKATGQNITVSGVVNGILVLNEVKVTDDEGKIVLNINDDDNYYITVCHDADSYYTEAEKTISNINVNVTSQTTNNKTVNITAKSNIFSEVMPGKLLFILPNGTEINANYAGNGTWWAVHAFNEYGVYQVSASYVGLDNVIVSKGTITVTAPEHTFWFLNYTINGYDNPVIELSNDFYFDSDYDVAFANGIVINRSVIIQGNGCTIDANEMARIFKIADNAQVVIKNVTLVNGKHDEGGAIYNDGSNLTIIDSTLDDNYAYDGGGAVYVKEGILTVITSALTCNGVNDYGGAIYINGGSLEIFNSTLNSNSAEEGGGAIYSNGNNLTIVNSTLDNNRAYGSYGGAVHNGQGYLTVIGSRIRNNYAEDDVAVCTGNEDNVVFSNNEIFNGNVYGFTADDSNTIINPPRFGLMAVFDSSLRIRVFEREDERFNGDITLTIGGEDYVVHMVNGTGKTDVIPSIMASGDYYANITFNGNEEYPAVNYENVRFSLSINSFSNLYALFIDSMIEHKDVVLNRDYIDDGDDFAFIDEYFNLLEENALAIDGKGHIIDCDHVDNFLYIGPEWKVSVKNLIIINSNGAAIHNEGNLTVTNSTFHNNSEGFGGGAAIYNNKGHVTIIGSTFSLNNGYEGGAILNERSYLTIINSTFTGNKAEYGAAIYNNEGNVVMDSATFINNYASDNGGAIYIWGGDFSIISSEFNNNSADDCGGAIYVSEWNDYMASANPSTSSHVFNSQANNKNYLRATSTGMRLVLSLVNSIFDSNTAGKIGGAIFIGGDNVVLINKSSFNKNNANRGGSICNRGVLNMYDSNLTNNSASVDGGAIFSSDDVVLDSATFINNYARDNGGAIYILSGNFEITESTFINNSAFYGGAIYVDVDNTAPEAPNPLANDVLGSSQKESILTALIPNDPFLKVTGSTFKDNHAYNGGAICNGVVVSVIGTIFENNMANHKGGAIYNNCLLTMTNSILINNLANNSSFNTYGGAIYNSENGDLRIIACDLSHNTVNGRLALGGAIYNEGETHVRDSTLTFNRAIGTESAAAGAIYNQNKLFVINTTFSNNTATATLNADGGAILSVRGELMVDDSIFSGNVASGNQSAGGAIVNLYANATIKNTTFQSNGANNGSAVLSASHEGMPPSNVNIEDSKFIDDSIEGVVLDDSNAVLTTPVFEIHVPDGVSGESVEITVNEIKIGNKFNGTVTVRIEGVDYPVKIVEGRGNATIALAMVSGTYKATLIYLGDLNYSGVTMQSDSFVVSVVKPDVVIPSLDGLSSNGVFTIVLSDDATGNVTLTINGKDYVFDVAEGKTSVKLPELVDGEYDYVISYSGDGRYSSFTSSGSLKVSNPSKPVDPVNPVKPAVPTKPVKTTLTLKKVTVKRSAKKLTIQATLKVNGKAVKGKIIKFKFNKKTYKARTNAKGVAKITVKKSVLKKLKKGKKVTYSATYGKITKKVKVKVKK